MACIRKRRGKWVADYRDQAGKRRWETYDTRKEAEQAMATSTVAMKNGRYVSPTDRRTLKDAYDSWLRLCVEGSDNKLGKPLRPATQAIYSMTWRVHLEERWGSLRLQHIDSEAIARWKQDKLDAGCGKRTVIAALQVMGSLFRHARRFKWISVNPLEDVHRPKYRTKVRAFTPAEIAVLVEEADAETALFIRTAATTGLRFGELAGLRWSDVDLENGVLRLREQFVRGTFSELKTANSRRTVPLSSGLLGTLKARYAVLNGNVVHLPGTDGRTVFHTAGNAPLDYHNFRHRVWVPLLARTGPNEKHPKRVAVKGKLHMLRHAFATALIQSGQNAKTIQTVMGHFSVAFTMDQYADVWPEQVAATGNAVADLLFPSSGSKTVASEPAKPDDVSSVSYLPDSTEEDGAGYRIRTCDPLITNQVHYQLC